MDNLLQKKGVNMFLSRREKMLEVTTQPQRIVEIISFMV